MKFRRSVIYEIEARDLDHANEIWDWDGPEALALVKALDVSPLEPVDESDSSRLHKEP